MNNVPFWDQLSQANDNEVGDVFNSFMHEIARTAFTKVLFEEVEALCGKAYHPLEDCENKRAGSAPGRYFFESEELSVQRPRVRAHKDGKSKEIKLKSYEAAQNRNALHAAMIRAFSAGMPSREQKRMFKNASGTSHGEVSKLWQAKGEQCIESLRGRDLNKADYVALMLDGIGLGDDLCAIVALGITVEGEKHILDFQIGSSENSEVCKDLLNRMNDRGFKPKRRLLVVTDGSKALRSSVRKKWPTAILQRCLVHKMRNIKGYMSHANYGELERLFARLRKSEGLVAAQECFDELRKFIKSKNAQALISLDEAGDEILAVHSLNAPNTLNITLLSTNCIENSFRNVRAKIGRVKRWRPETKMASKWLAYALLEAERGFRKINKCDDMKILAKILEDFSPPPPEEGVKASPSADLDKKPPANL